MASASDSDADRHEPSNNSDEECDVAETSEESECESTDSDMPGLRAMESGTDSDSDYTESEESAGEVVPPRSAETVRRSSARIASAQPLSSEDEDMPPLADADYSDSDSDSDTAEASAVHVRRSARQRCGVNYVANNIDTTFNDRPGYSHFGRTRKGGDIRPRQQAKPKLAPAIQKSVTMHNFFASPGRCALHYHIMYSYYLLT